MSLLTFFRNAGINRWVLRKSFIHKLIANDWFMRPYLSKIQRDEIVHNGDPVRYGAMLLALEQIDKAKVEGSMAECGVWKGYLSKFIRTLSKERNYYLFDTFSGFDSKDKDNFSENDKRFQDTSVEGVLKYIDTEQNIIIKKGYFPQTTLGLEKEQFAFVVIDFDKYEPTKAALEFFYPKLSKGSYVFIHDYNSPESNWACCRAVNEFLEDKIEIPISIPDAWGSCLFVKI